MRLSRWFFGLAATGTISGAIGWGCGSSNKGAPSPSDSGAASTPEVTTTPAVDAFVCMPEALAGLPNIFGGGGLGAAMCFTPLLSGGGGIAGLLGGGGLGGLFGGLGGGAAPAEGGAADGGAASGSPTTNVISCLATTCSCLGAVGGAAAEAGTDAAPAPDSGGNTGAIDAAGQ
jgi:hypothetical protein